LILIAIVAVEIIGVLEWTSPREREDANISGPAAPDDKS
jgi:hypothetical protein